LEDGEGYKALLVDQNGREVVKEMENYFIKDNGYKLLTCFYFQAPEGFS
jgi:hypothetical protein